jgi:hypothetical protein
VGIACTGGLHSHKRPHERSERLTGKGEIQAIGLSINELQTHLPAGAHPGFFSFPNIRVKTGSGVITQGT